MAVLIYVLWNKETPQIFVKVYHFLLSSTSWPQKGTSGLASGIKSWHFRFKHLQQKAKSSFVNNPKISNLQSINSNSKFRSNSLSFGLIPFRRQNPNFLDRRRINNDSSFDLRIVEHSEHLQKIEEILVVGLNDLKYL